MAGNVLNINTTSTCLISLEEIKNLKKSMKEYAQTLQDMDKLLAFLDSFFESVTQNPPLKQQQLFPLLKAFTDLEQLYGREGTAMTRSAEYARQAQMALVTSLFLEETLPPPPPPPPAPTKRQARAKPKVVRFKVAKKEAPPPQEPFYPASSAVEVNLPVYDASNDSIDEVNYNINTENGLLYHLDHPYDNNCM